MRIAIRADANTKIATGHIMRCMSIASRLTALGHEVLFVTADNFPCGMLEQNGFDYKILNSDFQNMNDEIDTLKQVLCENFDCILVDSYFVTPEYFKSLKGILNVAYIDDVFKFDYDVNIVINYNINSKKFNYSAKYKILSPRYAPLRQEFEDIPPKKIKQVTDIMITTGGTDEKNICASIAKGLENKLPHVKLHLIAGRFFKHDLNSIACQNIIVHKNAKMSDIMKLCDMAVSAGGTTIYELCACGIPTVLFSMADNQIEACKTAAEENIMLYAGHIENNTDIFHLENEAVRLAENICERERLSRASSELVDGKGALKIAQELAILADKGL